jgi:hypothetical protein
MVRGSAPTNLIIRKANCFVRSISSRSVIA